MISPWLEGWFMPALMAEAGLNCDLVSACPSFQLSHHIRHLEVVEAAGSLAPTALKLWQEHGPYEWVITMNDSLQGELAQRALLDPRYFHLLPLTPNSSTAHLHSKIGLSRAFSASGIPTPAWRVAHDPASALQQSLTLGWPVLVKQDGSAGGRGVWRCETPKELAEAASHQAGRPFLIQQWRSGSLYSVEALYRQGSLELFTFSAVEASMRNYGPSIKRRYGLPVDEVPYLESLVEQIGIALGLHGFTNMSLIHTNDGEQPLFFECDVRPVAWLWLDHVLGGDFAYALNPKHQSDRGQRNAYAQLSSECFAPFLKKDLSEADQALAWPYSPPEDNPAFLNIVLTSGMLHRA